MVIQFIDRASELKTLTNIRNKQARRFSPALRTPKSREDPTCSRILKRQKQPLFFMYQTLKKKLFYLTYQKSWKTSFSRVYFLKFSSIHGIYCQKIK
jgi:hypothetical protein